MSDLDLFLWKVSLTDVHFVITDLVKEIPVSYKGILPDLFKEGKGAGVTGIAGILGGVGGFKSLGCIVKESSLIEAMAVAIGLTGAGGVTCDTGLIGSA